MKILNSIIALIFVFFLGCDDSLNGPVGSNLNYEPKVVSVGETADFGTIENDVVKIRISGVVGSEYQLEHSNKICGYCPLSADNENLRLVMCNGKYEVTFKANSLTRDKLSLQLQYYKNL